MFTGNIPKKPQRQTQRFCKFADDMEYILKRTPSTRQTALFSATIPGFIRGLIRRYLDDPRWIQLVSDAKGLETVDEVDQATRIVKEYADAEKNGLGAITVDGKMIDVPVAERAEALLARHWAIVGKEEEK